MEGPAIAAAAVVRSLVAAKEFVVSKQCAEREKKHPVVQRRGAPWSLLFSVKYQEGEKKGQYVPLKGVRGAHKASRGKPKRCKSGDGQLSRRNREREKRDGV